MFRIGACYAAMMVTVIKALGKLDAFHAEGHVSGRHSMKEKKKCAEISEENAIKSMAE